MASNKVEDAPPAHRQRGNLDHGRKVPRKVSVGFSGLTFQSTKKKVILNDISGFVEGGEFCGILGPSGSGKTCLLDAIALRKKKGGSLTAGKILFEGKPLKPHVKGQTMCYVAQEDVLFPSFTVRETVSYAVWLEYGLFLPRLQLRKIVDDILDDVGLASSADVMVTGTFSGKGLSGGQRRRLMIAVELVACPSVMILDEPTSGLDFASAYGVMKELKRLTELGHTVIAVIHQPSSQIWDLLDCVGFISRGSFAYFGPPKNVLKYFARHNHSCPEFYNPAEFILDLLQTSEDDESKSDDTSWMGLFAASEENKGTAARINSEVNRFGLRPSKIENDDSPRLRSRRMNVFSSALVLIHRNLLDMAKNPSVLGMRLFLVLFITVLICLTFYQVGDRFDDSSLWARASALFFLPSFTSLVLVAVLPSFMNNRTVIKKEIGNGRYGALAYAISLIPTILLSSFILAISVSVISYYMLIFRNFIQYALVMWSVYLFTETLTLACGVMVPHYLIGILNVLTIACTGMSVEGYFIQFNEVGSVVQWLGYITPNRYSFRAFMLNEFQTIGNLTSEFYPTGQDYLNYYDIQDGAIQDYTGNFFISLAFVLIAYFSLVVGVLTWHL